MEVKEQIKGELVFEIRWTIAFQAISRCFTLHAHNK